MGYIPIADYKEFPFRFYRIKKHHEHDPVKFHFDKSIFANVFESNKKRVDNEICVLLKNKWK